ncbi:CHASE2 domain-containing protein [Pseudomonas typographi]|uniref:CHASE2 domain-containing protein n=1 Tax=Pseudomonas typographi TaxID=2715964 RepID=UPI001EEE73DC|nr:CHASE2 domain-containing protein [Pseudomonas typographi]
MSAIYNHLRMFTCRQYTLAVLLLFVALLDPFSLSAASDSASATWLNRVFASFYPTAGRAQITVVLIDDAYLTHHNTYWPLPYDEQSKLFRHLLRYQPSGVFVDLMYSHDHTSADPAQGSRLLANVFARYQDKGVPLWLANTGEKATTGMANTLNALMQITQPALVTWAGWGDHYPLAVNTALGVMETPALAMYRRYCQAHRCDALPKDAEAAVKAPSMAIQWGARQHEDQEKVAKTVGCAKSLGPFTDAWHELTRAFKRRANNDNPKRCAYNLTLSASDLEVTGTDDQQLVGSMLQGRLVLVGADITSAGDTVNSPVHGDIAGVYQHAMALDNLIVKGMNYDSDPKGLGFMNLNWLDLLQVFLLAVIAVLKKLMTRPEPGIPRLYLPGQTWPQVTRVAGAFMVVLALLSVALHLAHITPANVLGIAVLSLALFSEKFDEFIARRGCLPISWKPKGHQG